MDILYHELCSYDICIYYLSLAVVVPLFIIIHFQYAKYFLINRLTLQNTFMSNTRDTLLEEVRTIFNLNISAKHCPRNHLLTIESTVDDTYYCSLCLACYPEGTMMYSCRDCNYDECFNCYNIISKKERFVHDPDSIGEDESDFENESDFEDESDNEVDIEPSQ